MPCGYRSMAASFSPGPVTLVARYLDNLWSGGSPSGTSFTAQLRADLAYLRPAAIVAVTSRGSALGQLLIRLVGRPTFQVGQVLVWRRQLMVSAATRRRSAVGSGASGVR